MTERGIKVAEERLLIRFLKDRLAIATAMKERDYVSLAGAAALAEHDVPRDMAMTHPARYRNLRRAITSYHLRGYSALNAQALLDLARASPRSA